MIRAFSGAACLALLAFTAPVFAAGAKAETPRFVQSNFTANKETYGARWTVPDFINGWGVAIRPVGAGGHFWVTAKDVSYEYVGDVTQSPKAELRTLHQDKLKTVKIPVGGDDKFATGVVYSDSTKDFVITQEFPEAEQIAPITAPAKFIFSSDGGIIAAWTERKKEDGSFDRSGTALAVIDQSAQGAQFFGLTLSAKFDRLYAANFGVDPDIKVFDGKFQPLPVKFDQPFDANHNGKVDPGEYAPFNIQSVTDAAGKAHLLVTYAKTQACPKEEAEKKACTLGELFAGEEDTSKPGQGRVAEFTEDGKLVAVYSDAGKLSAPWGVAYAPAAGFGKLNGALLVGNFGSGTIAAFNPKTYAFIDYLRDAKGKALKIEKVWGLLFGNGESLGDKDALYFAAGPADEKDGLFGVLRVKGGK